MIAADNGENVEPAHYDATLKQAVMEMVAKQSALGVDVVDDGELSKRGFAVYAHERLAGLEPTGEPRPSPWSNSRESNDFPEFYATSMQPFSGAPTASNMQMACTGPITYKGQELLDRDLANLTRAVAAAGAEEAFVPAISPSDVVGNQLNEFYGDEEEFLYAVADALNVEYRAIVDAGFLLQIDDPRLMVRGFAMYVKNKLDELTADHIMATPVGGMRLIDYLPTRTFELIIHTMDLAIALGVNDEPPENGLEATLQILGQLALYRGHAPRLILATTGRHVLSEGFSLLG